MCVACEVEKTIDLEAAGVRYAATEKCERINNASERLIEPF